jgi:hypothetical protein
MHFILRFFLSRRSDLPWDLIPFLDEAAERLLLRKIGGSYIFVHRQLLDYFASLDEPRLRSVLYIQGSQHQTATSTERLPS